MSSIRKIYEQIVRVADNHYFKQNWLECIKQYKILLDVIQPTEYMLIDCQPEIPLSVYYNCLFNSANCYKTLAELEVNNKEKLFLQAIELYNTIFLFKFEDTNSIIQSISIYTQLSLLCQENLNKCVDYLKRGLMLDPLNNPLNYNLGWILRKNLKYVEAITCFKICILSNNSEYQIRGYHNLAGIYKSVKRWPDALYYLLEAKKIHEQDPDICHLLGIVYTEMRRTDLAEKEYFLAKQNYFSSKISTNVKFLLAEINLNMGHMHSYNGDNLKSIKCYNDSLKIIPDFRIAFQNKLLNLMYFTNLTDTEYIFSQHQKINLLLPKKTPIPNYIQNDKLILGFVSGDFIDHPVSFFINSFIKNFDKNAFEVILYSQTPISDNSFSNCKVVLIKNISSEIVKEWIIKDNVKILIDLAGHTAENRLDIFSLRSAPIQISYCGYPFTTGLKNMDYKIVDKLTDLLESQKYYTEKLLFMPRSFLCYTPPCIPDIQVCHENNGKLLKIGCFNRLNKIDKEWVELCNQILQIPNIHFYFKTKALLNSECKNKFLQQFNNCSKITILDCNLSIKEHLLEYNKVDISLDTFPYNGTTTTCESLLMGVPVLTLKGNLHLQNVSSSILYNSDLKEYISTDKDQLLDLVKYLANNKKNDELHNATRLKEKTRNKFLNGVITNKDIFVKDFSELLIGLS